MLALASLQSILVAVVVVVIAIAIDDIVDGYGVLVLAEIKIKSGRQTNNARNEERKRDTNKMGKWQKRKLEKPQKPLTQQHTHTHSITSQHMIV